MKICYKILTHNETDSLEKLLDFLFENIKETDHIIVVDDFSDSPTRKILSKYAESNQYDYFQNKLTIDDLKSVIYSFSEFNVPLSQNDCLTINEISDLRYNEGFVANLFNRLKNKNDNNKININGNYYNVCLDIKSYQIIEAELTKYIELKTLMIQIRKKKLKD